jgi:hypothetical protein
MRPAEKSGQDPLVGLAGRHEPRDDGLVVRGHVG